MSLRVKYGKHRLGRWRLARVEEHPHVFQNLENASARGAITKAPRPAEKDLANSALQGPRECAREVNLHKKHAK